MIRFDDLPSDPLLLKQKLIETMSIIEKVSAEKLALADDRNVAIAQRDAALQENEKLLLILSQYKRALFGRRSEKMDADQLQFLLSGNEQSIVSGVANENAAADAGGTDTKAGASDNPSRPRPNRNRGMLPVHLPRVDVVIDVESKICPCCGGSLHKTPRSSAASRAIGIRSTSGGLVIELAKHALHSAKPTSISSTSLSTSFRSRKHSYRARVMTLTTLASVTSECGALIETIRGQAVHGQSSPDRPRPLDRASYPDNVLDRVVDSCRLCSKARSRDIP
jgi:Transposase C of IS166 homeodomain